MDLSPSFLLQLLVTGMALGCLYAMVAVGFNVIYNATGIINLAQGEFVVLGGLAMIWANETLGLPVWAAVPASVAAVGLTGVLFERIAIRPLRNPSVLILIIITIAGAYLFRGGALLVWGKSLYSIDGFFGDEPVRFLGAVARRQHFVVFATLLLVAAFLALFFGRTLTGKAMRATSFNAKAARLVGVNARSMVMLAFGLSAAIGALAGCVVAPISGMDYSQGPLFGLKGFAAAVLGGLGNYPAAVAAGLLLGVVEALAMGSDYVGSGYKDAVALGVLLVVLFVRPRGLFGKTSLGRLSEF